ncbi:glycoside hydrolase family 31 protein [Echinicola vietnamensis]|uniref:Family 31 glycosyl hydrolase, alpha-glucosidase n=1 Tax=Echinicola vietnamensis (strain DSM 17526 / LMG 23754 / KMM 6221) TaxID=926556 RepID=L0FYJ7_ECHVK|nr:TIM-barrel domain-containing protein [Echinicola vietnamensis]AGA77836.1 family 31 glycosyl hydrolase, alpha-glucosidase [Echinicola vietnamensis DSM 17526]
MNHKHFFAAIFIFLTQTSLILAQSSSGKLSKDQNTYRITAGNKTLQLQFHSPEVFRVKTFWGEEPEEHFSYMLKQQAFDLLPVQTTQKEGTFVFDTGRLLVKVDEFSLNLAVYDTQGNLLSGEDVSDVDGGAYQDDRVVGAIKTLQPDEHFFGFGERMDFLDRRGKEVDLNVGRGLGRPHIIGAYNVLEANYAPVPFFMSTKGYGIFFHNSYATHWDLGSESNEHLSFEAEGGELDYFFMYGPDFSKLLYHYTGLTGRSPLLPRFAHGLQVGTYSGGTWGHEEMTSTHYVVELARKYREKGIPFDVLHLDSTWRMFGENGGSGATTFEWRETFKDPASMFDSLYAMDINMVGLHLRPRFDNGKQLDLLNQAREQGFVYPEEDNPGEFVNFFDEEAVDWWWENGVMRIAEIGAMFLKTDEGSAFGRKANESDKTGPRTEEARRLHNAFPVAYAKAPYEKFKAYNGMRGMNHTREGYAGIQRYPFIWAGDWPSEWQYYGPVIKAGINIGLSGVGYWSHNMGGFEHQADPELFSRWVQFGMFSPVAHVFGMDHPGYKEPWNYGAKAEEIFTQYDKLRYRLIPYIYTTAFQQYQSGKPIMRALVLEHQDDYNTYTVDDQYYFGDHMIVCPVLTKEAQTRTVYLPEGTWYDYWDGTQYEGKQYYNIVTPLEELPIFVKAGAIIPMQDEVAYDNKEAFGTITLDIFPGGTSEYRLFEDDGVSEKYMEGHYAETLFRATSDDQGMEISVGKSEGDYRPGARSYVLKIHTDIQPEAVQLNGDALQPLDATAIRAGEAGWAYDAEANVLWAAGEKADDEEIQFHVR